MSKQGFADDITQCLKSLIIARISDEEYHKRNQYAKLKHVKEIINNYFDHLLEGMDYGKSE